MATDDSSSSGTVPLPPPNLTPAYTVPAAPHLFVPGAVQVGTAVSLGEHPAYIKCPFCSAAIVTQTKKVIGSKTWVCSLVGLSFLALCGFILPFVMSCTKDVAHSCPSCGLDIGVYKRPVI